MIFSNWFAHLLQREFSLFAFTSLWLFFWMWYASGSASILWKPARNPLRKLKFSRVLLCQRVQQPFLYNYSFSAHRVFLVPLLRWNCGKKHIHCRDCITAGKYNWTKTWRDKHTIEKTYITIDMLDKDKLE